MGPLTASTILLDLDPARRAFGDAASPRGAARGWDFLGSVPVPLRARTRDGLAELTTRHRAAGGPALKCCFPMGQGGRGPIERLRFLRHLDDFPRMLVSAEHGNVFNRRFHDRHVSRGAFASGQPSGVAPVFADCGLVDPRRWIGVFAVAPFVMLVDRQRLGGLPVPRRWRDLADPIFRDQVVFGGWRREETQAWSHYNKFFLLCMARELGLSGLARLVRNVPQLLHSAQMPRLAGTDASPGGIYVLPWSLADMCPRRAHTEVVWPEDGALAYPLWLTVQERHCDRLDVLSRHFHGAELGRYLAENRYPPLCPDLAPALPGGARLKWLGWDYVRHPATADDVRTACRIFLDAQDRRAPPEIRSCA